MDSKRLAGILKHKSLLAVAVVAVFAISFLAPSNGCQFPAIYNLGDSNSDTGSVSATFGRVPPPHGQTFFHKPSGRYSDGRLIIDFIAEKLGVPFLSPYLDAVESNFRHGANFAASGSTIQPAVGKLLVAGFNPLSLQVQLRQFEQLKDRTNELPGQGRLPRPEEFAKALYTLDTGQNDLHYGLETMTEEKVKASIPNIINHFSQVTEGLYKGGARTFLIHNTGPIGCLPYFVINFPPKPGSADQVGCIKSYNDVAQGFNQQLRDRVSQLRDQLQGARLIYVDMYAAKYSLISQANKYGFTGPFAYCCGHLGDYRVACGQTVMVNGTEIFGASCSDPSKYISWDGVHYTEAANHWVANRILDGSFSDPPIPVSEACH